MTTQVKQTQRHIAGGLLEEGSIYFVYIPVAGRQRVQGLEDVRRFYIVLHPKVEDIYRVIVVGRKRLPREQERQGFWAYVDMVTNSQRAIREKLGAAARPLAEGVYGIILHDDHTHICYELELPEQPGTAQRDVNIGKEGSFILAVKNPELTAPVLGLPVSQRPYFPEKLQERFRDRRFIPADPPIFLDYRGTELFLMRADDNVKDELGIDLDAQKETERTAEVFRDLRMKKSSQVIIPLFQGEWA